MMHKYYSFIGCEWARNMSWGFMFYEFVQLYVTSPNLSNSDSYSFHVFVFRKTCEFVRVSSFFYVQELKWARLFTHAAQCSHRHISQSKNQTLKMTKKYILKTVALSESKNLFWNLFISTYQQFNFFTVSLGGIWGFLLKTLRIIMRQLCIILMSTSCEYVWNHLRIE